MAKKVKNEPQGRQRAVIFDFDGTLVDSLRAVVDVFEDITGRHEHFSDEQVNAMRDVPIPQLMKQLGVPRWKAPLLLMRGRKMIRKHLRDMTLHKGIDGVLHQLHKDGVPLFVLSSNSTENVRKYLRQHELLDCFVAVYGGASVFGKAPRLLKLVDRHKIDIVSSWYVGDETRDVSAARAVGFRAASVAWGFNTRAALEHKEPDVLADTPAELLKGLQAAWKKK